jgi:hypothetical protein
MRVGKLRDVLCKRQPSNFLKVRTNHAQCRLRDNFLEAFHEKRFSPVAIGAHTLELTSLRAAVLLAGTGSSSHNSQNGSSSRAIFTTSPAL